MSCCSRVLFLPALLLVTSAAHGDGRAYLLGGGLEVDSADGVAVALLGNLELATETWLSASFGRTDVELPRRVEAQTIYAHIGIDHYFEPVGVRASVAYWGDHDLFDSIDYRGALYTRAEWGSISLELEHRDFELDLPAIGDLVPPRDVGFSAFGAGLSGRVQASEDVDLFASGMSYDYDVPLRIEDSDRLLNLLSISRLSLLSSLIDWRVTAGVGFDVGSQRLEFDVSKWRGSIDGGDNFGATVSFLTPVSDRTDLELRLGYDDSELYGDVTVLSLFLYFYGG